MQGGVEGGVEGGVQGVTGCVRMTHDTPQPQHTLLGTTADAIRL